LGSILLTVAYASHVEIANGPQATYSIPLSKFTVGDTVAFTARYLPFPLDTDNTVFDIDLSSNGTHGEFHCTNTDGLLRMDAWDGHWLYDYEEAVSGVQEGDIFKCRIRVNDTGFEIRFNDRFTHFYRNRIPSRQVYSYLYLTHSIALFKYRIQREFHAPLYAEYKELKFGNYIFINGIARGDFGILLRTVDSTLIERMEVKMNQSKIVRAQEVDRGYVIENRSKVPTTPFSLEKEVEFEIVIANKKYALEYYVNGDLLNSEMMHALPKEAEHLLHLQIEGEVDLFEVSYKTGK
ncbi:hypothetical protein PMAYCL1PPCAC_00040, partial [Pristionchus mayeri]